MAYTTERETDKDGATRFDSGLGASVLLGPDGRVWEEVHGGGIPSPIRWNPEAATAYSLMWSEVAYEMAQRQVEARMADTIQPNHVWVGKVAPDQWKVNVTEDDGSIRWALTFNEPGPAMRWALSWGVVVDAGDDEDLHRLLGAMVRLDGRTKGLRPGAAVRYDVFGVGSNIAAHVLDDGRTLRADWVVGPTWNLRGMDLEVDAGEVHDVRYSFTLDEDDRLLCECGNTPETSGFETCNAKGAPMEPLEGSEWAGHYRCNECYSVHLPNPERIR